MSGHDQQSGSTKLHELCRHLQPTAAQYVFGRWFMTSRYPACARVQPFPIMSLHALGDNSELLW